MTTFFFRRLSAAMCLALVLPQLALAHGPSRRKITESIEINAPPEKVWKVIGDFHNMSWLPGVEKTTGEGGNTPEAAKRQIILKGGATVDEELFKYNAEEHSYSYRIDKVDVKVLPVNDYSSTISVLPGEGGKSTVEWKGAFYRGYMLNDPPPELNDEASMKAVSGLYRSGLENLKKEVEAGE